MSELQGLNPLERNKLLAAITDPRDLAIVVLGLLHGFRSSEIADLKMSDIDLNNGLIRIRRGKGSETNDHTIEDGLEALNERTVLLNALAARPADESPFIFVSQKGGKLHRSQIFRIFQQAATKAGLPWSCGTPSIRRSRKPRDMTPTAWTAASRRLRPRSR